MAEAAVIKRVRFMAFLRAVFAMRTKEVRMPVVYARVDPWTR